MNRSRLALPLLAALLAGTGGPAAFGQAVPPPPTPTPWNLFGLPTALHKIRDATCNHDGNHPNLERQPHLKRIGDPANLQPTIAPGAPRSTSAASVVSTRSKVQAEAGMAQPAPILVAAQIKTQEDLKGQKIKGLKYLGTIGCGCYAKKYDVEGAFLEALEDCTEEVRYEAVKAITAAACSDGCNACKSAAAGGAGCDKSNCCTKAIVAKLSEMAYKQDKDGCWIEPSARVRAAAVRALNACYPHLPPEVGGETPETPEGTVPMPPAPGTIPPAPGGTASSRRRNAEPPAVLEMAQAGSNRRYSISDLSGESPAAAERKSTPVSEKKAPTPAEKKAPTPAEKKAPTPAEKKVSAATERKKTVATEVKTTATKPVIHTGKESTVSTAEPKSLPSSPVTGSVLSVDTQRRRVELSVESKTVLPVGTKLQVFHSYLSGKALLTELEVVESIAGQATARPLDMNKFAKVARGDEAITVE